MRNFAFNLIVLAAVSAGLDENVVELKAAKTLPGQPKRRVEVSYLSERYTRIGRNVAKFATPGKEGSHRTIRKGLYQVALPLSVTIHSDDEAWLAEFSKNFVLALPVKTSDEDGNLVVVKVDNAALGGFNRKMVEVFKKRSKTFHITVTGMLTQDSEIPLITEVHFNPEYREANSDQE